MQPVFCVNLFPAAVEGVGVEQMGCLVTPVA